jgi:hypothetical protein
MICPFKHPFLDDPSSYDEVYQQTYTLCILINNPQDTVNHKNCFFPKLPKMQFTYKYVFFQVHPCPKDGFRLELDVLRGVAQLGRAPGLGPGGRRFESYHPDFFMRRQTMPMPELASVFSKPCAFLHSPFEPQESKSVQKVSF